MAYRLNSVIRSIQKSKNIGGNFGAELAIVARALLNKNNILTFDPDNLALSLSILCGDPTAGDTIAAAIAADPNNSAAQTILGKAQIVTRFVPTNGATIGLNSTASDETVVLQPAGQLSTMTLAFPADNVSRIGQIERVYITSPVVTLTVTTPGSVVLNPASPTYLAANYLYSFQKIAANTWEWIDPLSNVNPIAAAIAGSFLDSLAIYKGGGPIVTPYTPVTTNTINMNANGADETLYINPAGTIAALTIVFPTDATSSIGQVERIFCTQIVTALTVTLPGSVAILGATPTALTADGSYSFQKVATNTWARLY